VLVAIKLLYKELLYFTFDPFGAEAVGLPIPALNFGLMAAITLTIVAGIQTVGVILVVALMVTPAATAYLLVKEVHWMMLGGAGFGMLGGVIGMYISYYLDIPCGPAIALTVFAFFFAGGSVQPPPWPSDQSAQGLTDELSQMVRARMLPFLGPQARVAQGRDTTRA
jgi:ABC-type Mn2+/Zn2+ transport system permease subunit